MTIKSKLKYLAASILAVALTSGTAFASLTTESRAALSQLKSQNPAAAKVSSRALAVLVLPNVVKAGFIFGAQGGEGILFVHGKTGALPDGSSLLWLASRCSEIRLRALFHESKGGGLGK